jgi:hypothetical protein
MKEMGNASVAVFLLWSLAASGESLNQKGSV